MSIEPVHIKTCIKEKGKKYYKIFLPHAKTYAFFV